MTDEKETLADLPEAEGILRKQVEATEAGAPEGGEVTPEDEPTEDEPA